MQDPLQKREEEGHFRLSLCEGRGRVARIQCTGCRATKSYRAHVGGFGSFPSQCGAEVRHSTATHGWRCDYTSSPSSLSSTRSSVFLWCPTPLPQYQTCLSQERRSFHICLRQEDLFRIRCGPSYQRGVALTHQEGGDPHQKRRQSYQLLPLLPCHHRDLSSLHLTQLRLLLHLCPDPLQVELLPSLWKGSLQCEIGSRSQPRGKCYLQSLSYFATVQLLHLLRLG
mmetsp:Transcript_42936/g.110865  ORF Transcript_42936/g.110865 Transcript_42936/m.110865 type:complete len:226 (-) Transcript_42936:201-878(-)